MTQEHKKLLLKDLCGRLPYGVKCYITEANDTSILAAVLEDGENTLFNFWEDDRKIVYGAQLYISEFKPYLFPLSSMTEEQKKDFIKVAGYEIREEDCGRHTETYYYDIVGHENTLYPNCDAIGWLNAHHFDYNGLIEKGLANDATGLNIY